MNKETYTKSQFRGKVEETVRLAETLRSDPNNSIDISLAEVVQDKFNCTLDSFYNDLGVDPTRDTISNLFRKVEGKGLVRKRMWMLARFFGYMTAFNMGVDKARINVVKPIHV